MAGRTAIPKNDKEELLYYKGLHQIRQLVTKRLELMEQMRVIDNNIAGIVVGLKRFVSWKELGEMLNMSETQAKTYLSPLMGETNSGD